MTNLLIGGTGFIGTALTKALIANKQSVISFARDRSTELPGVEYVYGDLDQNSLPNEIVNRADNIFVLIGQIGPGFAAERELATLKRLAESLKSGSQKIYYFSSSLVYGHCEGPADEQHACAPVDGYARFKLDCEHLLARIIPNERLTTLRLANIYGSPASRGFIGLLMRKMQNREDALIINGDGQQERDYLFIDDLASALVAVAKQRESFGIVNIATGRSHRLIDVVRSLEQVAGQSIKYQLGGTIPDEADVIRLSNRRLREEYCYGSFLSLEEGLEKTLERHS